MTKFVLEESSEEFGREFHILKATLTVLY